ncbi:unnamed protein product, partial [Staurois parvus]
GDEDFFFFYTDCFYTHKGCKSNNCSFSLAAFLQPLRNTVRAVIGHSLSHVQCQK